MLKLALKLAAGLSSGGLLSVLDGALAMVNGLMKMANERSLINRGKREAYAAQLIEISKAVEMAKMIDEETAAMTDEQIYRELEQQGDFRD